LFTCFALTGFSQWAQDSLSLPRMLVQAVTFRDKVYFIGGEIGNYPDNETSEVAIYDCLASAWLPSDSLSLGRSASACVSGDSGFYVVGGRICNWSKAIGLAKFYDASNRIDIFKNGVWHTDSLPDAVWGGRAVKVGSKLLFTGFVDSINYISSCIYASKKVYVFDESTGLWSTDSLSGARTELGAATDGTLAIFAGGVNGLGVTSDVVDIYNSVTNTWTTSQLSVARGYVGAAYENGKFYFAGGVLAGVLNQSSDVIDIYDGTNWTTDHLSLARAGVMVAAVNDEVYFMGGSDFDLSLLLIPNSNGNYNTVDVLNTVTGAWSRQDFNYQDPVPFFGSAIWHQYAGITTWGNKIFVAGGGVTGWLFGNTIIAYTRYIEIRDVTLGLRDVGASVSFDLYPNPSTGSFTLLLPEARAEIRITDLLGQEVWKITATSRTLNITLDANGVYLVHIQTRQGSAVRKLVIRR